MRPTTVLLSTLALTALAGCFGTPFTTSTEDPDSGTTPDCCGQGDTGSGHDAGKPDPDAGRPDPDSGNPGTGHDSGTPTDAGSEKDSSTPPPDSGCMSCGTDSGSPMPDSGTPDSGMSMPDSGMGTDSGTPDSGMADSGMADSGAPDSGMGMDSGTDSGGGMDAGTDAAPEAGPCVDLTTTCAGMQPLICQAGSWVTNGGPCDYACNAGACLCNDPVGDGGGRFKPIVGGGLEDTKTGETWYATIALATSLQSFSEAQSDCAAYGARVPHLSELSGILAEQPSNGFCPAFDADSQFAALFSMKADWYWTDTAPPGRPLDQTAVNFQTGNTTDVQLDLGGAPYHGSVYVMCISP